MDILEKLATIETASERDFANIKLTAIDHITQLREQIEIAKKDSARLDYLDSLNDILNKHYKTNYGFKLHCSHNVIRIFSQSVNHIDLNDANSGIDKYTKVREAIDNVMKD